MKTRLQQAGLLRHDENVSEINISVAWRVLSRLGCPARYCGKSQDGSYEYVIINPKSGDFLASGKGGTLEYSICEAVLNAYSIVKAEKNLIKKPIPTNRSFERTTNKGEAHEMPIM